MIPKRCKTNLSILVPRALLWPSGNTFVPAAPGDSAAGLCDWMAFSPSACVGSSAFGLSLWQIDRLTLFIARIHLAAVCLGRSRETFCQAGGEWSIWARRISDLWKDNRAEMMALTPSRLKLRASPNSHQKDFTQFTFFFPLLGKNLPLSIFLGTYTHTHGARTGSSVSWPRASWNPVFDFT